MSDDWVERLLPEAAEALRRRWALASASAEYAAGVVLEVFAPHVAELEAELRECRKANDGARLWNESLNEKNRELEIGRDEALDEAVRLKDEGVRWHNLAFHNAEAAHHAEAEVARLREAIKYVARCKNPDTCGSCIAIARAALRDEGGE